MLAIFLIALVASVVVTPLALLTARRVGVVDIPGPLKVHASPIPLVGGVGVMAGVAVAIVGVQPSLLVPLGFSFLVGLVDDLRGLSARTRLVASALTGLAAAQLILPYRVPVVPGTLAAVALFVLLPNAVNLIDGLDALSGGVCLSGAIGLAVLLVGDGRTIALALAAGILGFLVFNRPPARVFLGSCGANLLGGSFASLIVLSWRHGVPASHSLAALLMVAVPVAEIATSVIRRARAGVSIVHGDRGHSYDQLIERGFRRGSAVGVLVLTQAALVAAGLGVAQLPTLAAAAAVVALGVGLLIAAAAAGFLGQLPDRQPEFEAAPAIAVV